MNFKKLLEQEERKKARRSLLEAGLKKSANEIAYHIKGTGSGLLASPEWKTLRRKVIQKYGAKCEKCSAIPTDPKKVHVDHIKPRKYFPELSMEESNLQVLCARCNKIKGNIDWTDYRVTPRNRGKPE